MSQVYTQFWMQWRLELPNEMDTRALRLTPCELHARALRGNNVSFCSLANSLKIISLLQTRGDSGPPFRNTTPLRWSSGIVFLAQI